MKRIRHKGYFLPEVQIKDYNAMIDGQNFFDQPVKNDLGRCDNKKNTICQVDDYKLIVLYIILILKNTLRITTW